MPHHSPAGPARRSQDGRPARRAFRVMGRCCLLLVALHGAATARAEESERFFENEIRPILVEKCGRCHDRREASGGLLVESRESLLRGGDRGPAIVPKDPNSSLLIQAVRRTDDLEMPPDDDERLNDRQVAALARWVELGAPWPATSPPLTAPDDPAAGRHWAFQPVVKPDPPAASSAWARTPIDRFVLEKLDGLSLAPSRDADRRTQIRRVAHALTGLPPTVEEVERFVADTSPDGYERLVDRLLDSPRYGQHWARHWLDVARYSDTKGYVYAREERFWVHAWTYRDWVVSALNEDLPYDRFLLLQLAADQIDDRRDGDLAAMGFLTLGRRFLGVHRDIIDDRIDVVCRGTMGLTVGCARCHDHKYDPIPTADYYSLYGVFDSCAERLVSLTDTDEACGDDASQAFRAGLEERREQLRSTMATRRREAAERARARVADYLKAQTELEKIPPQGFDQVYEKSDLLPEFVRRWETYLRHAKDRQDPVFSAWHAYAQLDPADFARQTARVTRELQSAPDRSVHPLVARAFAEPPESFDEVVRRYGELFQDVEKRRNGEAKGGERETESAGPPQTETGLGDPADEALRQVLYGPHSPCVVPDEPIVQVEAYFDTGTINELWKLQGEVDRWIINAGGPARFAVALEDRPVPSRPRIFRRGNPLRPGPEVPRRFLSVLSRGDREPFRRGSGRLELARSIVDPHNPLTARVIVNRVWAWHFGQGLVKTPSDFGLRAGQPSHPELLDWLAAEFVQDSWSLKKLQRRIVLSSTFRQSSEGPADEELRASARGIDPDNRYLWRWNRKRLTFEELRDSMLAASGQLDDRLGGKPQRLFEQPFPRRRTLYGLVDRQFLPGTLRVFDFANPDLHIARRTETTVPQQALFFLNHPLVLERARALAEEAGRETPRETIAALFRGSLQRSPSPTEFADAMSFVQTVQDADRPARRPTADDWRYGYGEIDEQSGSVRQFTPLPHFSGTAWQGGDNWPDPTLGWVRLTADGGHPGNDRRHAAIRRWTAPRAMNVEIRSKLEHRSQPGDGIRAFIVGTEAGRLGFQKVHVAEADLDVPRLEVAQGESIDFVVDIDQVLNSDEFRWNATIREIESASAGVVWNSRDDFTPPTVERLSPWEQLAQVLLCTNEFLFVD